MIRSSQFFVIILLSGWANFLPAMYRPRTDREWMFYNAGLAEMKDKANRMENEMDEWRDYANRLKDELKSAKEELKLARVANTEMTHVGLSELDRKDRALIEAGCDIENLEEKLKDESAALVAASGQVTQLEETLKKVRAELVTANQNNGKLRENESQLSKEKKRLSAQFEGEIAGLASVSDQKHQLALSALAGLRKEISPLRRELSPLRRQVATKDAEIARLQQALAAAQAKSK